MSDTIVSDHELTQDGDHNEFDTESPDQNLDMDLNSIDKATIEKCKSFDLALSLSSLP